MAYNFSARTQLENRQGCWPQQLKKGGVPHGTPMGLQVTHPWVQAAMGPMALQVPQPIHPNLDIIARMVVVPDSAHVGL